MYMTFNFAYIVLHPELIQSHLKEHKDFIRTPHSIYFNHLKNLPNEICGRSTPCRTI